MFHDTTCLVVFACLCLHSVLGWRDQCQLLYHKWCCVWSSWWNTESYAACCGSGDAELDSVNIYFLSCSYCTINMLHYTSICHAELWWRVTVDVGECPSVCPSVCHMLIAVDWYEVIHDLSFSMTFNDVQIWYNDKLDSGNGVLVEKVGMFFYLKETKKNAEMGSKLLVQPD